MRAAASTSARAMTCRLPRHSTKSKTLVLLVLLLVTLVQQVHALHLAPSVAQSRSRDEWANLNEQVHGSDSDISSMRGEPAHNRRGLGLSSFFGSLGNGGASDQQPLVPFVSPSNGTDIRFPVPLIKCHNQTRCIQPYLQLQHTFKVYYCKHHKHGVRFHFLAREGLLLHPNVQLVESMEEADVIVYLPESAPWHKTECTNPAFFHKTVVLDEGDHANMFDPSADPAKPTKWLLYFKRSFVRRSNGRFVGYMPYLQRNDVLPMSYTIADAYVRNTFPFYKDRALDLVSTLRGGSHDPCRLRVREWADEYCKVRKKNCRVGQVNHASRTVVDKNYLDNMYKVRRVCVSVGLLYISRKPLMSRCYTPDPDPALAPPTLLLCRPKSLSL